LKPNKEILLVQTLSEAAEIIGVNIKTLSKYLDIEISNNSKFTITIKNYSIKRIKVFK